MLYGLVSTHWEKAQRLGNTLGFDILDNELIFKLKFDQDYSRPNHTTLQNRTMKSDM